MSLASFSVRRPIAASMGLLCAVLLGAIALGRLELTLLPEISEEEISVWIGYPEAGVPEIEEAVARPAENAMVAVEGVRSVRTEVVPGGVSLTLRLQPGSDPDLVTLSVRERLEAVRWELPEEAERPLVLGGSSSERPVMVLAIAAEDLEGAADWARSVLRPRLEQVDGVARAQIEGAPNREIRILPDRARCQAAGISVERIAAALRAANVETPGGTLRRRGVRYALTVESEIAGASQIADILVSHPGEPALRIRDLARVEDGTADPEGWTRLNGRPAVGVLLYREAGANLLHLADAVRNRLAEIKSESAAGGAPGFQVAVIQDPAPLVRSSIRGLWQAVFLGGLLAFGVLLYFLRDLKTPILLMAALPVSVLATFVLFDLLGLSLNVMSMGGIALGIGMLVDNSIVCLENIHRLRGEGLPPARAAIQGAGEVSLPMLASTLTTCAVFLPLAWLPGSIGSLLRDQAVAVTISLLVSLVTALTLLPMLASRIAPRAAQAEAARMPLFRPYHRLLKACLRRPGRFLGVVAALTLAALGYLLLAPREILPEVRSRDFEVHLELPPGSDATATDASTRAVEQWLLARPEVEQVHATIGAAGGFDPAHTQRQFHQATLRGRLGHGGDRLRLMSDLRARFPAEAGWNLEVEPAQAELATLLARGQATLACEITGPDPAQAESLATRVAAGARRHLGRGASSLRLRLAESEPRFTLKPKAEALWRYGISEGEALAAVEAMASGLTATHLRRFDEEDPVVLYGPRGGGAPLSGPVVVGGRSLPLDEMFQVRMSLAPASLLRVDQQRVAVIRWDGRLRQVTRARQALLAALRESPLPPGYTARFTGAWQEMRASLAAVLRAFLLSAGLVFLILAAQFESLRLPFVIFTEIPLAVVGVAPALLLAGGTVNVLTGIGLVILNGVVVNDSILKVDLLRRLQCQGYGRVRSIFLASRQRYRPILMTSATTVLALAPQFFGPGAELRSSLAATMIGGLTASTVLTLLVVPVIFHRIAGAGRGPRDDSRLPLAQGGRRGPNGPAQGDRRVSDRPETEGRQ